MLFPGSVKTLLHSTTYAVCSPQVLNATWLPNHRTWPVDTTTWAFHWGFQAGTFLLQCFVKLGPRHPQKAQQWCLASQRQQQKHLKTRSNKTSRIWVLVQLHSQPQVVCKHLSHNTGLLFQQSQTTPLKHLYVTVFENPTSKAYPHWSCVCLPTSLPCLCYQCKRYCSVCVPLSANTTGVCSLSDAFQRTVQKFGGVDIVCNNAGIINEGDWEKTVAINLVRWKEMTLVCLYETNTETNIVFFLFLCVFVRS